MRPASCTLVVSNAPMRPRPGGKVCRAYEPPWCTRWFEWSNHPSRVPRLRLTAQRWCQTLKLMIAHMQTDLMPTLEATCTLTWQAATWDTLDEAD